MKTPATTPWAVSATCFLLLLAIACGPGTDETATTQEPAPAAPEPALMSHSLSHTGYSRDLDGTPVRGEYTTEIQIGTPPQSFEVVMDSGSSNLIVLGDPSICDNCGSEPGRQYSPAASSTSQARDKNYSIQYGSGALDATEYSDTVALPGRTGFSYTFGVMTHDASVPNILGLAYKSLAQPQDSPLTPWFDALVAQTGIPDQFSLLLCGAAKGGKIELGGHSVEPTAWMDVTKQAWYVVEPDSLRVKGSTTSLGSFAGVQTIVDSGTTELIVPPEMFNGIVEAVANAAQAAGIAFGTLPGGGYGVDVTPGDFSSLPTFQVVDGENTYDIAPSTYLAPVPQDGEDVYMLSVAAQNQAILGQVFIENYYTVFDRESDPNRVGFAPIGGLCD